VDRTVNSKREQLVHMLEVFTVLSSIHILHRTMPSRKSTCKRPTLNNSFVQLL